MKSEKKIAAQVFELAGPLCHAEGIELVHVEYQRESGGRTLRIYIDKPQGVTLQDCTVISRQINSLIDVHLDLKTSYRLEVSSPGLERPLGKDSDYLRFQGHLAKIRTYRSFDGQKNFTGVLLGLSEGMVTMKVNNNIIAIPYDDICRARLVDYRGESYANK